MLKSSRSTRFILPVMVMAAVVFSACTLTTQPKTTSTLDSTDQAMAPTTEDGISPNSPSLDQTSQLTSAVSARGTVYSQTVFYSNPAGGDDVGFTVTIDEAGTIIDAETEVKAVNQTSVGLQNNFKANVKEAVVGKKLSGLQVDRIGGASLTTGAFKEFLSDIQSQS